MFATLMFVLACTGFFLRHRVLECPVLFRCLLLRMSKNFYHNKYVGLVQRYGNMTSTNHWKIADRYQKHPLLVVKNYPAKSV
jgi:hypothetical protein